MTDLPIRKIVLEMSMPALRELVGVIRARPDVSAIEMTTRQEVETADELYRTDYEGSLGKLLEILPSAP